MTNIAIIDNLITLAANLVTGWILFILFGRLAKMFQNHQYPQLIGTLGFFILIFALINAPSETVSMVQNIWGQFKGKLGI